MIRTKRSYHSMKQRCYNEKCKDYYLYGGRGIKVCERWLNFKNFLDDMGDKPEGLVLDRKDNNGHYEPFNCRWVNYSVSNKNRRAFKKREKYVD